MDEAERYNKELSRLLEEVELKAKHAQELKTAEIFELLIASAAQAGINRSVAIRIIEADQSDYKAAAMVLIEEIKRRRLPAGLAASL